MVWTTLDAVGAQRWALRAADAIAAAKDELTQLDRLTGDGDHGINLTRGFQAVTTKLRSGRTPEKVGDVLDTVAATLMSTVGGASGPLYGTAFLRAGRVAARAEVDAAGLVAMLEAGLEGIETRGRAQPGEKTMVDAWAPAVAAAAAVIESAADAGAPGPTLVEVLTAAADAADSGARATIPLVAMKGRAAYLGERSAGHMDPGARSTAIILRAALDATLA
jgi:dihydroxyacetone kinase-like protein